MNLCEYGCGKEAKFKTSNGKWCCCEFYTKCSAVREKSIKGLKKAHRDGKMFGWGELWKKHDLAWNRGKTKYSDMRVSRMDKGEIFIIDSQYSTDYIKNVIIKENLLEYKCSKCNIIDWNGEILSLELDHINGKSTDNRIENLRFLCPNCHSQTPTFRGRNKNTGKVKVTDARLRKALKEKGNIREALLSVGLAAKGASYIRAKRFM